MSQFDPAAKLSKRTSQVEEAIIVQMAQKARDLRTKGLDVVGLTIGEPDFDTPEYIRKAAEKAMADGHTHYAPMNGIPELRQALAEKFNAENRLDYAPNEISLSNGAKQSITNTIFAVVDPGDEVILLAPIWVAYEGIIQMVGGIPRIVHAGVEDNFKVPASRLADALTERTKLIILNSPNNPTGAVYTRDELSEIAKVISAHPSAFAISDEIYEYILFDGEHISLGTMPGMRERTITVNGFSKGFAMTGWRLGYTGAPEPVTRAITKVQGTFTAGANAFVQRAAIAAIKGDRSDVEEMRLSYLRRRELMVEGLAKIPGIIAPTPAGAFYMFADFSAYLGKRAGNRHIATVTELADWLLEKHLVATVPGTAFGDSQCIRFSFAASDADIKTGLDRLAVGLAELE
ncbi:MAG: pyridoxal phosphate-dependent aminotransferase [Rhizobiales bacterium]|nr:pyridoxal phosphate-dependent aminotransferase [Hyphomicrobiales bacterium]